MKRKVVEQKDLEKLSKIALDIQSELIDRGIKLTPKSKESWEADIITHIVVNDILTGNIKKIRYEQ